MIIFLTFIQHHYRRWNSLKKKYIYIYQGLPRSFFLRAPSSSIQYSCFCASDDAVSALGGGGGGHEPHQSFQVGVPVVPATDPLSHWVCQSKCDGNQGWPLMLRSDLLECDFSWISDLRNGTVNLILAIFKLCHPYFIQQTVMLDEGLWWAPRTLCLSSLSTVSKEMQALVFLHILMQVQTC